MPVYYICPFHELFPEQAWKEYRTMELQKHKVLPSDGYALIESYCIDPDCDCRRVMLNVISRDGRKHVATISFGFDRDDEAAGPYLDPLNPQSEHAQALLKLIEKVVLADPDYVARLESHYHQVKEAVSNPTPAVRHVMRRFVDEL
jgi:hypothetical protein